jgi:hypothetical protein
MPPATNSRISAARRRARRAKMLLAATGALAFAASMALARANQVGHVRHTVQQLTAPRSFQAAVRSGRLQGGVVGAPQAPPSAVTASS